MKSDRDKTDKKSSKRPHLENDDKAQTLAENKDGANSLEKLPKDILEKMALSLDVESLYSFASATLFSKKINPVLNSVLRANSFWQQYAERNPLSSIDNSNQKKGWLQTQYIKTKNIDKFDYDYLWESLHLDVGLGAYTGQPKLIVPLSNNDNIQKILYDHIKTQFAIDSRRATEKYGGLTILYWAMILNRVEDVERYLQAKVCVNIFNQVGYPLNTPETMDITKRIFFTAAISGYDQIIKILCDIGAYNPDDIFYKQTVVGDTVYINRAKVLDILLEHGASSNLTLNGTTLLILSAARGFIDCANCWLTMAPHLITSKMASQP
jgi:hypothetical protein